MVLDKVRNLQRIIKHNNGIIGSFLQYFRYDELKWGDLVGTDKYGNKYYENKYYFIARSRWVDYSPQYGWDYDGSQIPAEWHKWMHYMTDDPPTVAPPPPYKFIIDHKENLSGRKGQYVPYSTTKPKIEAWQPPK